MTESESGGRDLSVDVLRGLAIVTMVAANLAAEMLRQPHPFWLRAYGSFAAPTFVVVAGMMVGFTTKTTRSNQREPSAGHWQGVAMWRRRAAATLESASRTRSSRRR